MNPNELDEAKRIVQAAIASGRITITQSKPIATRKRVRNAANDAAYAAKWRERNRARGLCPTCGHKKQGNASLCARCRKVARQAKRKAYERNLAEGLCTNCGKERDHINPRTGVIAFRCRRCTDMNTARTARSKAAK